MQHEWLLLQVQCTSFIGKVFLKWMFWFLKEVERQTKEEAPRKWVCLDARGFITFLCRRSVGYFSQAFLVFLMKESKKRIVSFTASQFAWCRPLMNPLLIFVIFP